MGDIEQMHHQVGQDAAAKIPEPAPIAKAILIERLLRRIAEKSLPIDRLADRCPSLRIMPRLIAVPGQMHLVNLAELAATDDLSRLLKLRHAALLHADLHDAAVLVLRVDDGRPFGQVVRERLFDIHVLAGGAGVDRHRHVPMVGRGDQHGVDVLAVQQLAIVLGGERRRSASFLPGRQVLVPHVADGGDPHARHLLLARPSAAGIGRRCRSADVIVSLAAKPRAVAVNPAMPPRSRRCRCVPETRDDRGGCSRQNDPESRR